jgi:hypothetical protein
MRVIVSQVPFFLHLHEHVPEVLDCLREVRHYGRIIFAGSFREAMVESAIRLSPRRRILNVAAYQAIGAALRECVEERVVSGANSAT